MAVTSTKPAAATSSQLLTLTRIIINCFGHSVHTRAPTARTQENIAMPTKKTWLLRLPEIRKELSAMNVPVVDRAVFERLFGVRRRRAIQLLHYFGGYQSGRTFLVDRLSLIEQLAPLEASADFAVEQRRRQRLVESLENLRRSRASAAVVIRVEAGAQNGAGLPAGVQFEPGLL